MNATQQQHERIKGYRTLSDHEIELLNESKALAEQVGALIDKLSGTSGIDQRFLTIGKTDLQKGFMAVARSIARPTSF